MSKALISIPAALSLVCTSRLVTSQCVPGKSLLAGAQGGIESERECNTGLLSCPERALAAKAGDHAPAARVDARFRGHSGLMLAAVTPVIAGVCSAQGTRLL